MTLINEKYHTDLLVDLETAITGLKRTLRNNYLLRVRRLLTRGTLERTTAVVEFDMLNKRLELYLEFQEKIKNTVYVFPPTININGRIIPERFS